MLEKVEVSLCHGTLLRVPPDHLAQVPMLDLHSFICEMETTLSTQRGLEGVLG